VRYRARVEYDGTDFAGFQAQPGARTVQGELEAALASLTGGCRVRVDAAGRTDAGVHAAGQVIAFTYRGRLGAAELGRALDALLPRDVAVRDLRRTPLGFHPRYAARYREYRYTVWNGPRSPLHERFALGVRIPLDTAAMARAASALEGRHDFTAFGAASRTTMRTVHRVRVRREGPLVTIDVRGDAFLRRMVRRIAAALLLVGRGEVEVAAVAEALASRMPAFNGAVAPARGLCLRRVVLGRRAREKNGDR
jgi:tRNA pseudouridine38-40 synthase